MKAHPPEDLTRLSRKGYVRHRRDGKRHVYRPTIPPDLARREALGQVAEIFFKGSSSDAILALLDMSVDRMSAEDLHRIAMEAWKAHESRKH